MRGEPHRGVVSDRSPWGKSGKQEQGDSGRWWGPGTNPGFRHRTAEPLRMEREWLEQTGAEGRPSGKGSQCPAQEMRTRQAAPAGVGPSRAGHTHADTSCAPATASSLDLRWECSILPDSQPSAWGLHRMQGGGVSEGPLRVWSQSHHVLRTVC